MTKSRILLLLAVTVLAASCATAPPPAVKPAGDDRFLIDPRIGYDGTAPPALTRRFDEAWRFVLSGNDTEARRRLASLKKSYPEFAPAPLAEAVMDIRAGRYAEAAKTIDAALEKNADYLAALVYRAEIAAREKRTRAAFEQYRVVEAMTGAPAVVAERRGLLQAALFGDLLAAAKVATGDESIRLLRETLTLDLTAFEPRALLARQLLAQRQFVEARKELDPLLDRSADRTEVQEMLAEIDFGEGRYQEAILRYDRLAKRTKEERFARRLEEIKREWSAANMPAYYRAAMASPAVTRAQLAVLLYWSVPSIRFAQNLGTPPIAIDVADVEGREEMIRAIALGLFDVDPVTRTVSPSRQVTAERFARLLVRVLQMRGATCAKGQHTDQVLGACGVDNPLGTHDRDALVTGADALKFVEQLAKQV